MRTVGDHAARAGPLRRPEAYCEPRRGSVLGTSARVNAPLVHGGDHGRAALDGPPEGRSPWRWQSLSASAEGGGRHGCRTDRAVSCAQNQPRAGGGGAGQGPSGAAGRVGSPRLGFREGSVRIRTTAGAKERALGTTPSLPLPGAKQDQAGAPERHLTAKAYGHKPANLVRSCRPGLSLAVSPDPLGQGDSPPVHLNR